MHVSSGRSEGHGTPVSQNVSVSPDHIFAERAMRDATGCGAGWARRKQTRRSRGRRRGRWRGERLLPGCGEDAQVGDVDDAVVVEIAFGEVLAGPLPVGGENAQVGHVNAAIVVGVAGEGEEVEL